MLRAQSVKESGEVIRPWQFECERVDLIQVYSTRCIF